MKNIRIRVQYDGTRYKGWQRQVTTPLTIQGKIEKVLSVMQDEEVTIDGAGRTDAGVHAMAQVANFALETEKTADEIGEYLNQYLPEDIRITQVEEAGARFHSRLNATGKTYRYECLRAGHYDVFRRDYAMTLTRTVSLKKMREAAEYFLGTHDFAGFCTHASKKKSTVRTIESIRIEEHDGRIVMDFHGNGFLYNMVRIIVGTLLEVGYGDRTPESMKELLQSKERKAAGETAPAKGLTLLQVNYD